MATLVFFHAHPDDESIGTGGTMAKAAAEGHRVVLVVATRGEQGEVPDGFLDPGEELADRRTAELEEACAILGVHRLEFLGYRDSGMMGTPENEARDCFWQADLDEAAKRLATILQDEAADVLVFYDDHGLYGHPDHIQVYRVGERAAELAGVGKVYEMTMDRDYLRELWARGREMGLDLPQGDGVGDEFGSPGHVVTTRVDITPYLEQKRAAMAAHASQIGETSFFLAMPPPAFAAVFGIETYILRGAAPDLRESDLLEGVA